MSTSLGDWQLVLTFTLGVNIVDKVVAKIWSINTVVFLEIQNMIHNCRDEVSEAAEL